jgi:hypothetical protein
VGEPQGTREAPSSAATGCEREWDATGRGERPHHNGVDAFTSTLKVINTATNTDHHPRHHRPPALRRGEKKNSYIPMNPEKYYTETGAWKSWDHFLGVNRHLHDEAYYL